MGTVSEWANVFVWGGLWAGLVWWFSRKKALAIYQPKGRTLKTAWWGFAGLLFGILTTFHWERAVHPPIVFVTVSALAGIVAVRLSAKFLLTRRSGQ